MKTLFFLLLIASACFAEESDKETIPQEDPAPVKVEEARQPAASSTPKPTVSPSPAATAAATDEKPPEERMLSSVPTIERVKTAPEKEPWDLKMLKEFFTKATLTENPALIYSKCKPLKLKELKNEEGWVGVRGSLDKESQTWAISGSSILYLNPKQDEGTITYTPGISDFDSTPEDFVKKLQVSGRMNLKTIKGDTALSLVEKTPTFDNHEVMIRKYAHPSGKTYYLTMDVHKLSTGKVDPDLAVEYAIFSANRVNSTEPSK